MKKYFIYLMLMLPASHSRAHCVFAGLTLNDLREGAQFARIQETSHEFPTALFNAFKSELGRFSAKRCAQVGMEKLHLSQHHSYGIYTAYYTHHEDCDGGNSYGVIVEGLLPLPPNAVAVIQDSFVSCL